MEIVPPGTPDPTSALYNSTLFLMAALLGVALVANLLVRPVDPRHHLTVRLTSGRASVLLDDGSHRTDARSLHYSCPYGSQEAPRPPMSPLLNPSRNHRCRCFGRPVGEFVRLHASARPASARRRRRSGRRRWWPTQGPPSPGT